MRNHFWLLLFFILTTSGYCDDFQNSGWLQVPDDQSTQDSISDDQSERERLVQWLATAPRHGINLPQKHLIELASDPSMYNLRLMAERYASYLDTGFLDKHLYQPGWHIKDIPALPVLSGHLDVDNMSLIEPQLPQYQSLKSMLATLKTWLKMAVAHFPDDQVLEVGDRSPSVEVLNQWLIDLDITNSLSGRVYSRKHKKVISSVQRKGNIWSDGRLGARTRQALVALTNKRIETIKVNLERLRWLPRDIPYPYVWVDITNYDVAWVTGRKRQKHYKAIIGQRSRQTPVFKDEIEGITVNPYWRVPSSIASTSILRSQKKDSSFLKREGFVVYDSWKKGAKKLNASRVNWHQLTWRNFPYRLEQKPGKVNRLGRYKLDSPNAYSIYLHDTNKPRLFQREKRMFSSGCGRVEDIERLIGHLLADQKMSDKMTVLKNTSTTTTLELRKPVAVYFAYFTAWPDSSGRVRFRDDIYQLDDALLSRL